MLIHLVFQGLPAHLERKEKKGPGDEGEIEEREEIRVSWDILERAASEALWDLWE